MKSAILVAIVLNVLTAATAPAVLAHDLGGRAATAAVHLGRTGPSLTVPGVIVTHQDLVSRPQTATSGTPREAKLRRPVATRPIRKPSPTTPPAQPAQVSTVPNLPQTLVDEILGPQVTDTIGFVPPDTMGAAGPTQFLFAVNGRLRGFNKNLPHTQIFDTTEAAFWGPQAVGGVSDAHVRYDPTTQRWFITEIDTTPSANHILLAVSNGPDLVTASFTEFQIPATGGSAPSDQGCFADYDTPGIDQNGIYIGANIFGGNVAACPGTSKLHSNLYVLQKSSALTLTLHFTPFYNVVNALFTETIQGVDSIDALATGYAIAADESLITTFLSVWQINSPSTTTPILTGPTSVAVTPENGTLLGISSANNVASAHPARGMDAIDDRLFSAVVRNGHLWTAHNVATDSTGNSNGSTLNHGAVRWYDITTAGLTVNQFGTVFDSAGSGFLNYWMGTVMVSGQGHVAMGLNRANGTTVVQAGAMGRLAGDTLGTMGGFSVFQSSTAAPYDDFVSTTAPNRWGDFTYTSLDPCDDTTMWTAQEYVAGAANLFDWGIAAEKLQAPPPATPSSANPSVVTAGQASVNVIVTGLSTGGAGFYDTPSTITDPCRKRLAATVSGGVVVNSITYTDPTHITLNLSTVGVTAGLENVTITNPDGQVVVANNFLTVTTPTVTAVSPANGPPAGGNPVTVMGTGFSTTPGATTVAVGANPATGVSCSSTTTCAVTVPAGVGTVDVRVTVTTVTSPINAPADQFTYTPPVAYNAVTPVRLLDTRSGGGPLGPMGSRSLAVAGVGVVPAGATAVVVNVTVTNTTAPSFLTAFPAGATRPLASNLNWVPGETIPNLVSVQIGSGGAITFFNNAGMTDVVVDLEGYYAAPVGTAGGEVALTPARITDTRTGSGLPNAGNTLGTGGIISVQVTSAGGVPGTGVSGAILNVTVTNTTGPSFLTVWPKGTTRPTASNLNWVAGVTIPNRVFVPIGAGGQVSIFNNFGSVDVIVDVSGYFTDATATGKLFISQSPIRIADTRISGGPLGPAGTFTLQVSGASGVPSTATAVIINVTVTNTTNSSFLTVFPSTGARPLASDLNWVSGDTIPNLVVATLGATGAITFFNNVGSTDVIVDIAGWYG